MAYFIVFKVVCADCGERQSVKFQSMEEKIEKITTTPCKNCGALKLYSEKSLTHRNLICNSEDCDYEGDMFFESFEDYSIKIKTMPCPKCSRPTLGTHYKNIPIQYLADGFTNAYSQSNYNHKCPESQRKLDAALRENDALQYMADHDPKFIKAGDAVKRAEDAEAAGTL